MSIVFGDDWMRWSPSEGETDAEACLLCVVCLWLPCPAEVRGMRAYGAVSSALLRRGSWRDVPPSLRC
nr:hypothetical protein CFP56_21303 [Quercus suber]